MEAKETHYGGPGVTMGADYVRVAQYNLMIRQLSVALKQTTPNLSHRQRNEIYKALDWYRTEALNLRVGKGGAEFVDDLPPGRWPTATMAESAVVTKFERLQDIEWLRLQPYAP